MKGKVDMILIALYAAVSASALTLVKLGTNKAMSFRMERGTLNIQINVFVIVGLFMYIASFILGIIAVSKTNLNIFYPTSAGLAYILVCLLSYYLLKESITINQFVGIVIILCGVILMNIKRLEI